MLRFAEFHDSTLRSISQEGDMVILEMPHVYIFEFEGEPFKEPGAGYSQFGLLKFTGVTSSEIPSLPLNNDNGLDIWSGSILIDGHQYDGVFEIPLEIENAMTQVEIHFNCGATLQISCTGVAYVPRSNLIYLEQYRS